MDLTSDHIRNALNPTEEDFWSWFSFCGGSKPSSGKEMEKIIDDEWNDYIDDLNEYYGKGWR